MIDSISGMILLGIENVSKALAGNQRLVLDMPVKVDEDDLAGFKLLDELFARNDYNLSDTMANLSDLMSWLPLIMAMGAANIDMADSPLFANGDHYTNAVEARAIVGDESMQKVYHAVIQAHWWMMFYVKVILAAANLDEAEDEEE